MKKNLCVAIARIMMLTACLVAAGGCKKEAPKTQLPAGTVSAEKNSFNAVTSQLDAGGSVYLYLSTEQFLEGLSGKVSRVRNILTSLPEMKADDRNNAGKALDILTGLIKDSGIEDVSGFGMSSIALEKGTYHSKAYLHHYADKGSGFLWKLFGTKAHPLTSLDLLPSSTAVAMFSDVDVALLWSVIKEQVRRSGIPEAESALNGVSEKFEMSTGLKWEKVLGSLGGEFGVVLTLDESKKMSLPIPGQRLELPTPGLVLVASVKDDTIFNRVDKALEESLGKNGLPIEKVDSSGLKMRTVSIPLPLPIAVRPTIASSGGRLFISISDNSIQEMLAVQSGKSSGLKSTDEFKQMSRNVPTEGNHFAFASPRFSQIFRELQKQAMGSGANARKQEAVQELLQTFIDTEHPEFSYSVSANTDEGWLAIGNGSRNPATILALAPAAVAGVVAAAALPALAKAKSAAQGKSCVAVLRQIDSAKAQWALENNKKSTDSPRESDLLPFMGNGQFPNCPQGGSYTIGTVGEPPKCSVPGHHL